MDSGGPAARAWPDYTYPLYELQAQEFFNMTGCAAEGTADWDCLRAASLKTIVTARCVRVSLRVGVSTLILGPF